VIRHEPTAHLLLVGAPIEQAYADCVLKEITNLGLGQNVTWLGQRLDVATILRGCDIAVLSSASEGLPLALLEYGLARLPAVATDVGQCAEVLDQGRAGILVPPGSSDQLADALLSLIRSPERRMALGQQLYRRVQERYTPEAVIKQICQVYKTVLNPN
jgi:glycosyltransferase involved in cell wall biosynthesis